MNNTYDFLIHSSLPAPYIKIHIFKRVRDYSLESHSHELHWHVNYITSGSAELYIGNKKITVYKNQLVFFPPQVLHKIFSKEGYSQIGVDIDKKYEESEILKLFSAYIKAYPLAVSLPPFEYTPLKAIEILNNPTPININLFLNCFEGAIINALNIVSLNRKTISRRLAHIINENNPYTLTLSDVCRITNYSKTHIERLAQKELGCGITAYLNSIKLNKICSLLQSTDLTMSEIAETVGLYDASHLNTFFKKQTGITPGKFRENNTNFVD